jgi:hypothetical protein
MKAEATESEFQAAGSDMCRVQRLSLVTSAGLDGGCDTRLRFRSSWSIGLGRDGRNLCVCVCVCQNPQRGTRRAPCKQVASDCSRKTSQFAVVGKLVLPTNNLGQLQGPSASILHVARRIALGSRSSMAKGEMTTLKSGSTASLDG